MLKVIGAGLGRTGTLSLKLALEKLLGAPCYHMIEVFENPDHIPLWHHAALDREPDWHAMFQNYAAVVDWPGASFFAEISRAYPDAIVLLSNRDPEKWWKSVSNTIFIEHDHAPDTGWLEMWEEIVSRRFTRELDNKQACLDAYNKHYQQVRNTIPSGRLLEWQVEDGWQPVCDALGTAVPDEPFPHVNTTAEFRQRQKDLPGNP